jgi:hypothetical protein
MASTTTELYIKLGQVVIVLILLAYFLYRRYKDKIVGFSWFTALFGTIILQSIIEISLFFPTQAGHLDPTSSIQEIHMIPSVFALFGLFLYFEYIRHEKPNSFLLAFASTLVGAYITVYFIELALTLEPTIAPEYRISRIIYNILQAFVLGEALYVFYRDATKVDYKKLRRISIAMAVATGIGFLAGILKIFERWTILIHPQFQIYGAIPFSITFGILAIAFIFNPYYVYLLPTKINKILIFNDSGILLYSVRIGRDEPEFGEDTLFSGIVTALRSLIAETTGTKGELRKVSFRDKKLLVVENMERRITTLIICDSDSLILQTAAKHFTDSFCAKFSKVLDRFDGTVSIFDEASDIVRRVFPFVPPEEIIQD